MEPETIDRAQDRAFSRGRAERLFSAQTRLLELVAGGRPLDVVLGFLSRTIESEIKGALCSVLILDGDRLRDGGSPSLPAAYVTALEGARIGPGLGSCGNSAATGETTVVEDIETHPFWASYRDLARQHGLRSCWSSAIRSSSGAIIGTFAIYQRQPSRPSPADADLVATTTHIAGIAIERRRLDDALARRAAELVEANHQKDLFLAMLAHELRNPLAPICTAVEIMRDHPEDAAAAKKAVAVIDRQSRHLSYLVSDLMDVSRISSGRVDLRREPLGIDLIIEAAMEVTRPAFHARNHHVSISCPSPAPQVDVDRGRMTQVITNLLNNAAKYTPAGGTVSISARVEGVDVIVDVADSGIGLAPGTVERVFDLFFQADRSLDRSQGGLGIGLTMVKRLVELHGGSVSVTSPGLGRGSVFTLRLPLSTRPITTRPVHLNLARGVGASGEYVLVVDDNADAAEMVSMALEEEGFEVRIASDGPSALTMSEERRPSVVLLDIGLPGLNGYEVARQLRHRFAGQQPRVITLSGYGQPADREAALAAGADMALVKPVAMEVLLEAVRGSSQHGR